jgi:hypothetical protein
MMFSSVPLPLVFLLGAAAETTVLACTIHDTLPSLRLTFLYVLLVEFGIWILYRVEIYPRFFSPLRHLPQPKVHIHPS